MSVPIRGKDVILTIVAFVGSPEAAAAALVPLEMCPVLGHTLVHQVNAPSSVQGPTLD